LIDELFAMAWHLPSENVLRIAGSLVNLLAVSMITTRPLPLSEIGDVSRNRERIRSFVRRNLSDPDLNCAAIAEQIGLSVRQVHAIFSGSGTTLTRWVWDQRLMRIAAKLENPAFARTPVSSLAFACGFNDAAHFSRLFKTRYGLPPSSYRERHLGQKTDHSAKS
jgi:AraC family transcriptional activator of tynA and feaB